MSSIFNPEVLTEIVEAYLSGVSDPTKIKPYTEARKLYEKNEELFEGWNLSKSAIIERMRNMIRGRAGRSLVLSVRRKYENEKSKISSDLSYYKREAKELEKKNELLEKKVEAKRVIESTICDYEIPNIPVGKNYTIPVINFSDWHVEERVNPSTINNLNEFNPDIARDRVTYATNNAIKLLENYKSFVYYDTLFLILNGDMITGYIHEELQEDNYLSPTEATSLCTEFIRGVISKFSSSGLFKRIIVRCNFGNHGRTTKKKRHSTSYKNSYEWLMYSWLDKVYSEDPMVEFRVGNSAISYDIFSYRGEKFTVRSSHGDNISYQGGVGGVTIPANKWVMRQDGNIRADYTFLSHFHTLFDVSSKCSINGSLIGYSAYAHDFGMPFEVPQQMMRLIDMNRLMITRRDIIFCEKA